MIKVKKNSNIHYYDDRYSPVLLVKAIFARIIWRQCIYYQNNSWERYLKIIVPRNKKLSRKIIQLLFKLIEHGSISCTPKNLKEKSLTQIIELSLKGDLKTFFDGRTIVFLEQNITEFADKNDVSIINQALSAITASTKNSVIVRHPKLRTKKLPLNKKIYIYENVQEFIERNIRNIDSNYIFLTFYSSAAYDIQKAFPNNSTFALKLRSKKFSDVTSDNFSRILAYPEYNSSVSGVLSIAL